MDVCLFCKIAQHKNPAAIFFEDPEFMAFLDIFPNTKGASVFIPKKHVPSNILNVPNENLPTYLVGLKKASKLLCNALKVERCGYIIEGEAIDHFHIKIYPMYIDQVPMGTKKHKMPVYYEKYQGYLTSQNGKMTKIEDLNKLADSIKKSGN